MALAEDILSGRRQSGKKVVIIGGGLVGVETAHFLASRGVDVTIVEMMDRIAREAGPTYTDYISRNMEKYHVSIHTNVKVDRIFQNGVEFDGRKEYADTVIIASGYRSNNELVLKMKETYPNVHVVGDAVSPRNILFAVHEAFECGISL